MFRLILCGFIFALFFLDTAAQNSTPQPAGDKLADGAGKKLVERACLSCHAVRVVISKRATEDGWAEEVDKMVARGAILTDDETDQVVEYLATHYGPDNPPGKGSKAPETNSQPPSAK